MEGGEYMGYKRLSIIFIVLMLFIFTPVAYGDNIDPGNDGSQYCYGENIGWINLQPLYGTGITVTDTAVSGYAWGENIGWINMSPTTGGGVVNDGNGNLSGYAWAENVGWINFAPIGGGVSINPNTGVFSGYAWGENIGWINFSPITGGGAKTSWRGAVAVDADGDGYTSDVDCNDSDPNVHPGTVEICDGIDNDCNGQVDDGISATPTSCGVGACVASGTLSCVNGQMVDSCTAGQPTGNDDNCNGIDENCSGTADEGYLISSTACGVGACASTGLLTCVSGTSVDSCTAGQPTGNDDNCNGIDENCNGTADDNYAPTQTTCGQGVCASTGQLTCQNGSTQDTCTPGQPQEEICDGIDNDCNGSVDENYVFGGFQQPINSDGSSIFKAGSTIPVKIILTNCSGQSISTATVTIAVYKISNAVLGNELELLIDSSGNANTGNLFRYDAAAGQYIYNLSTKGYTKGTYGVYATPDNGQSYSVVFSLK